MCETQEDGSEREEKGGDGWLVGVRMCVKGTVLCVSYKHNSTHTQYGTHLLVLSLRGQDVFACLFSGN